MIKLSRTKSFNIIELLRRYFDLSVYVSRPCLLRTRTPKTELNIEVFGVYNEIETVDGRLSIRKVSNER